jgi:hypothetical protein
MNTLQAAKSSTYARTTGPIKNVKDMLSGLKLSDTPRTKSMDREVVNKVNQSVNPQTRTSKGSTTKKSKSYTGGGWGKNDNDGDEYGSNGGRMGHGFGGGKY